MCSRIFQQFAVRSNAWIAQVAKKSKDMSSLHLGNISCKDVLLIADVRQRSAVQQLTACCDAGAEKQNQISEQAQHFHKTFREEVTTSTRAVC